MKLKAIGFAVLASVATASAVAAELTLVGNSAANWDTTTQCWTNSAGTSVAFQTGDNVLISSEYFTGPSLTMTERLTPSDVVFDIDRTLQFGWDTVNTHGLGVDTKSFTKRGSGTLLLKSGIGASGRVGLGNGMTCGVEVVEGEIACSDRNCHNYLGPREVPYWVYVRDGASLTFLAGNQTAKAESPECGIKIQLDEGARLNHCTNAVSAKVQSALFVNTIKLSGGDIVNGAMAHQGTMTSATDAEYLGGDCMMKIFNTLWFSGSTPHAFGFPDNTYTGYKHYSLDGTLKGYLVSLNSKAPVEIRVDDIDNGSDVDAYMSWLAFTWGKDANSVFRCNIEKTGAGTLVFPSNSVNKIDNVWRYFKGDFTVKEGRVEFLSLDKAQFFNAGPNDDLQTVTVSTNATLSIAKRNITNPGDGGVTPNIKIVVDHGTLEYRPGTTANKGSIVARDWVFDDATLDISNSGPTLYFKNSVTFRGTRTLAMLPDGNISRAQSVLVHNGTNTTGNTSGPCTIIDVADMTGDGRTDVVMGYGIDNGTSNMGSDIGTVTWTDSGFIKTGAGTFSVASAVNNVSGVITVSNGTLRVDGVLTTPSSVNVASCAFLGGTGTVANVTMEAASGFAAPAGQKAPLVIQGDFNLPATGVIDILNLDGGAADCLEGASLVMITGTFSGEENLDNWTITIDGQPATRWVASVRNGVLRARPQTGMMLILR